MDIQQQIREYIVDNILFGDGKNLQPDTSFQEEGVFDSMGLLELIAFLEDTYDISVEDDDLTIENLGSVQDVSRLVQRKLLKARQPKTGTALIAGSDGLG
jgi:acyl carrier protein